MVYNINFLFFLIKKMLKTLDEAKEYAIKKIEDLTGEMVDQEEKDIIEMEIEEEFFERISDQVDEKELEKAKLKSLEDIDGYLFHNIHNYTTILEETTIDFLSEYLSQE